VVTIGVSSPPFSNSVAEIFLTGVVEPDPDPEPPVEREPAEHPAVATLFDVPPGGCCTSGCPSCGIFACCWF
jgi:hypothetical protein